MNIRRIIICKKKKKKDKIDLSKITEVIRFACTVTLAIKMIFFSKSNIALRTELTYNRRVSVAIECIPVIQSMLTKAWALYT